MEVNKSKKGRKKVADKKWPIRVYVEESKIAKMGGIIEAHNLVLKYIEKFRARK